MDKTTKQDSQNSNGLISSHLVLCIIISLQIYSFTTIDLLLNVSKSSANVSLFINVATILVEISFVNKYNDGNNDRSPQRS